VDSRRTVVLKGGVHPNAQTQFDRGPVDAGLRLAAITLRLKATPEQQTVLERLLDEQQDPSSPNYHKWLTPEEYAGRFGVSGEDMGRIAAWLESQGFSVDHVAASRNWIVFSGPARQVEQAFHTRLHRYLVDGEMHFANAVAPSIPADLETLVQVIQGLDDFLMRAPRRVAKSQPAMTPDFTTGNGTHFLTPADIATIYNVNAVYSRGLTGNGQKIAVVGQTNIHMSDIELFRSQFGLPVNDPTLVLAEGSADPGITGDLAEANLDLDWAGAVAPNATILYVYATNVWIAVQDAISRNLAPIISMSYGACEQKVSSGPSNAAWLRSLAQQANAQGITWVASSGDSGAAGCDKPEVASASNGLGVNIPASIPEVTAVGGTEFNDGAGRFWGTSNGANGGSALSYIPEMAWNDSFSESNISGSGGGASIFYLKPAWQTGVGVPNDNARDVPDVAFSASAEHDGYYIGMNGHLIPIGGTSAATPVFAGILALLNQAQPKPGLGNINPTLYRLASTPGIFHDVTVGSNIVPCDAGTPNCSNGRLGYNTGPGYDQVTGLGSVDAGNLVTQWNSTTGGTTTSGTTTTLTASPSGLSVGATTTLNATVRAASGTATPAGSVTFALGRTLLGSVNLSGAGGTAAASLTVYGSQLAVGANSITASYGGGAGFNGSAAAVTVTVSVPTQSSAVIPSIVPTPIYQQKPDANGLSWFFTVRLSEIAGVPTTLTDFAFGGTSYAQQIPSFFGSANIPAHGTLAAALGASINSVPATIVFSFSGRDQSGQQWSQQVSVQFFGPQISASMVLTSSPGTEIQNPNGDSHCAAGFPYYQQLNLQEQNGYEVRLTKFLGGSNDFSNNIAHWFGSLRLAPLGHLQAGICWQIPNPPTTLNYEIDGTDTNGNKITATVVVPFQPPGQSAGTLSTSRSSVSLTTPGASQSATASLAVSVPAGQPWTVSVFPANQKTSWLVVFPISGTGPSTVNVVAASAGLSNGVFTGTLVFQSVNTIPQFVNVPLNFTVGASTTTVISAVANGASFQTAAAPGMILSIFGSRLANTTQAAVAVPLPLNMAGVSATINGVAAPLYYVSPGQLNIQVPYETPTGNALLAVNNNGQVASYPFPVSTTAPGIFLGAGGVLVPTATAARGTTLAMYITGEGEVSGSLATGAAPSSSTPVSQLPAPLAPMSLTVGGVSANIVFGAIPYFLSGVTQINFTVPPNAPQGVQPVIVTVGGVASAVGKLTVQ
jgi:uncharacterized protein (TIGR03437 family)